MPNAKLASKQRRRKEVAPMLGVVGASLLAGGASATTGGSTADIPSAPVRNTAINSAITLNEEEIADVSLGTFYVFDKENVGTPRLGEQVAWGCRGCRCGCRGCRCGCRGCGCGGCGCCPWWVCGCRC